MVAVIGTGVQAKKLADKIEKAKKDKESRNLDPKTPKMNGDKKEDNTISKEDIDQFFENKKNKKVKKTAKNLQELEPAKPGIDKPTGKIQSFAKGGRAMYGSGSKVCKLAKRGKGKAYGKNS